jgi:VWFA-related protein
VDVRLVNVEVAVTDAAGNFVADLTAKNFRLREDGAPQEIAHFAPTRAPVRVLLLVEVSPAVFLLQREHLVAAHRLLRALRPEDQVALVSYARTPHLEVSFTRDKRLLERGLASLTGFGVGMAKMNLLDAVARTLDWLSPPPQRTAVVVIATGIDSGSATRWEELEQRLGASQVTFFTLATGRLLRGESEEKKKSSTEASPWAGFEAEFRRADERLAALAQASAGQAYFPESAKDLDGIYSQIAERLRNLYSLGYYPTNRALDATYRQITVELVDAEGAPLAGRDRRGRTVPHRVFARPGYFAPGS